MTLCKKIEELQTFLKLIASLWEDFRSMSKEFIYRHNLEESTIYDLWNVDTNRMLSENGADLHSSVS